MRLNKTKIIKHISTVFLLINFVFFGANRSLAQHNQAKEAVVATDSNNVSAKTEIVGAEKEINEAHQHHEQEELHEAEGKIDAGKLIMEHIADAHDWHIVTIGHKHISIPLPVIIKDDNGLQVFSSSRFEHGHAVYNGYGLVKNKIVAKNNDGSINEKASFIDLSITKNVAALFITVFFLFWMLLSVANKYKKNALKAPKGLQGVLEMLILFIRDEIAKPSIGAKYAKFLPFLLSIFFFIFLNNLFGLIPFFPGGANVTGNIAVTMVLAVFTFVITSFNGNKNYWKHIFLPPGVPKLLWILLIPIEIIGMLNKPIVLMIRLFANITAGHIIILGFFSLIFIFGAVNLGAGLGASVLSVAFTTFMSFLELLVAFLQAYVFTLLSALYFGSAVEEHHTEEHH